VPAITVLGCEGGWSVVLQVPAFRSEESLVLTLLTEDRVLVHPGFFFDFEREAFLVISLLPEPPGFACAVQALFAQAGAGR
jgi:alanine-synthesizing transaminase